MMLSGLSVPRYTRDELASGLRWEAGEDPAIIRDAAYIETMKSTATTQVAKSDHISRAGADEVVSIC